MTTLEALVQDVLARQGDAEARIWSVDEVTLHLQSGYQEIATAQHVFWDVVYLENLPAGFSYTAPWERTYLAEMRGFDLGCANFTAEVDRRALGDERARIGPANHTSPFEATDGWLASVGASTAIPATAEVPKTLTALDRVTWDNRTIEALAPRRLQHGDARYELTRGEVYGYTWQKDGVRTLRKVRVPAAMAATVTVTGTWGGLRRPTDLSTDTVTGTWGVPRRLPGHHPIGSGYFGLPRRPFLDGTNVRVEHFRHGRALDHAGAVCELPAPYVRYLRDYAQAQLLARRGPGQDLKLAAHFQQRWTRGLARLAKRLDFVDRERTAVLGGDGRTLTTRPPRPQRPWAYGSVVR